MSISHGKMDELKKRIFYTFALLLVYRLAAQVPVPGVNASALSSYFMESGGGLFDLVNTFSGGAFKRFSILALGVMPYITTSIIFSLLTEVIPQIQEMQEDNDGIKQIQKWTRYGAVVLACIQGFGMSALFQGLHTRTGVPLVNDPGILFKLITMTTLAGGTMFLLWLGERITEFGLENGVSLIIFTGIAVELPSEFAQKFTLFRNGELSSFSLIISFAIICLSLYVVTFIESSFRNIPVQYAKKVVNSRVYGGAQNLPLRLDTGGVMPPILASSLLAAPATVANFVPAGSFMKPFFETIQQALMPGHLTFNLLFGGLIFYMSFFYAPIQFKTKKVSEMLQKNNAFVPGVRPGIMTQEYLDQVLNRVTFFGAIFLIVICLAPSLITGSHSRFEGTSLLILVSVAMRVILNIQTFLYSDKYESAFKSRGKYNPASRRF